MKNPLKYSFWLCRIIEGAKLYLWLLAFSFSLGCMFRKFQFAISRVKGATFHEIKQNIKRFNFSLNAQISREGKIRLLTIHVDCSALFPISMAQREITVNLAT